jgi:uncharacterized protein (DUF433 family)
MCYHVANTRKKGAMRQSTVVRRDPEILGGTPVFAGTRVPAQTLLDYLETNHTLDEFLDDFPTVERDQATDFLQELGQLVDDLALPA